MIQYTLSRSGVIVKREQNSFRIAIPFSNYRSDLHIFGPDKETAYDIQIKGALKLNGSHRVRSNKDISEVLLNQGFTDKMSKYSQIAKDSNVSFVPLIFLDTGEAHHVAAKFIKWLCFVAITGSRRQKNKSVAIGIAWIVFCISLSYHKHNNTYYILVK